MQQSRNSSHPYTSDEKKTSHSSFNSQIKKILKLVGDEFVYGSHLLSLGAVGIVLSVLLIFNLEVHIKLLLIVYLITQIVYTYNHFRELQFDIKSNPERAKHISTKTKWVQISPFVYLIILCNILIFVNIPTTIVVISMVIGGIVYTEYFKTIPIIGFKNYWIAFFWSLLILLVPLFYEPIKFFPFFYLLVFVFLRLFINTVFFDIKDIKSDRERGLKTFPALFGKKKTLLLLQLLNIFSLLPILSGVYYNHLPIYSVLLFITVLISFYYLTIGLYVNETKLRNISYMLVDGEYISWPLIIFAGKLVF